MIYLELLLGFLKVGCFAFGGGYGAIPLIRDVVHSYGWLSDEMLTYMIAIGESTPGPIMVNLATYIGSSQAGIAGAFIATLAVVLPSFVVILIVAALVRTAVKNRYVQAVLSGLKPCITGIIAATGICLLISNCFITDDAFRINLRAAVIAVFLAVLMIVYKLIAKKKISPVMLIIISAIAGIVVYGL